MLRSIGKQSREIRGVSPEEEKEGCGGKDLQKRKVLSVEWKSEDIQTDGQITALHNAPQRSSTVV